MGLPFIFGILGSKQGAEKAMEEQGHFMYIGLGLVIIGGLILLFRHLKVKKTKEDETEDKLNIKV